MKHTPTVLQMETTECGAASLAVILQHHGRHVPMSQLRDACCVSRDGTNAAAIQAAARLYGLEVDGFMAEDTKDLRRWERPVILHWQFNHFLVLEGISGRNVMLNDPAIGRRRVTLAEFERSFTGVFLDLKPGSSFRRGGHPPRFWGAIAQRLALEKAGVLFTLITGLLLVLPQVLIPVFSQVYIDEIWGQGMQAWLKPMLWALVLVLLLQTLLKHLQLTAIRRLTRRLDSRFSAQFERHVLSLPERYFSQRYAGDINGRVELNREVASFLAEQLIPLLSGVMLLVFYLVLTLSYSPWLGGVVGISTGLNALLVAFTHHAHQEDSLRLQQDGAKAQSVVTAAIRDIETVKTAAVETDLATRYGGHLSTALNGSQRIGLRQARLELVPGLLNQVNNLAVLIVGFVLLLRGEMTLGMVLAAQQVSGGLKGEVDRWVAFVRELPTMQASLLRLEDVLGEPVDPLVNGRLCSMDSEGGSRLSGAITLEAMSFGYIPTQQPLLGPIDLRVAPGQRLALVGGSGSGKSTLARLLAGLERPDVGEILYDGHALEAIPRSVAVGSIALVQQEVQLYGVSVRDNLTLWNQAIPHEQLEEACRDAQILDDIRKLPQGFDTLLSEGGQSLSGGQRQRLEIARALVQNPAILILDEASSALDAITEQRLSEALRRRGCTQIVIAHRLSAIRDADQILVLEHGRVVQRGRHEDLLTDSSGVYAGLVADE
ncbi:NHLP family bacteriocin export ABC transporter peptidase/permease/ATPase subunit [Cyanobium gracile]|uniref:NHLM bacteriocin system ABC transporter, peptidase/ATP-binding protein n=1 Tax=Cyanobium gracile (strain ATCC 27147 / PCC 6307) TaxID=292564 RepID=K9P4J2_CYAGP|nr:NHLP family bacteriocin export ABC transporter peptidase/permease/ATPase subunit [Cyanobium gracile]AFY27474.1 NHLM bacteriocin system ABC transporter, peptidase/ATP-binding protein [Cyanobium gracile PCC 6307]